MDTLAAYFSVFVFVWTYVSGESVSSQPYCNLTLFQMEHASNTKKVNIYQHMGPYQNVFSDTINKTYCILACLNACIYEQMRLQLLQQKSRGFATT